MSSLLIIMRYLSKEDLVAMYSYGELIYLYETVQTNPMYEMTQSFQLKMYDVFYLSEKQSQSRAHAQEHAHTQSREHAQEHAHVPAHALTQL